MKNFLKNSKESLIILMWFLAVLMFAIFITSCSDKKRDMVRKDCVIVSVNKLPPPNTIQSDWRYIYKTECGTTVIVSKPSYKVGDTIHYYLPKNDKTNE